MSEPTLHQLLSDPFRPNVIGWKAQSVKNNRALAVAYIEARDVMNRLDEVVGPENWWADFSPADRGNVVCRLTLRLDGREVTKADIGGESDQPDEGDKAKAAFSDALKRAAVHWGIGRYLYYLPRVWCDYDAAKKQILNPPALPDWALPGGLTPKPKPAPAAARQTAPPADAEPDPAARLKAELARTGKRWGQCMTMLNVHHQTGHHKDTKFSAVAPGHLAWLLGQLAEMPDAAKKE